MKFFSAAQKKFNCHAISPDQRKEWGGCVQKAIVSQMHTYLTICDQKSEIIQIKYKNKYNVQYLLKSYWNPDFITLYSYIHDLTSRGLNTVSFRTGGQIY